MHVVEMIRSFVAIEIPGDVKTALAGLQRQLMSQRSSYVKWVAVGGIHLTLKFLGNVAADRVPEVVQALAAPARSVPPFQLRLAELGAFPNLRSPRVAWVSLAGDTDPLSRLQLEIEAAMETLGFATEERAFSPHLTLGRVQQSATPGERQELGQRLASLRVENQVSFAVAGISLMRSQLSPKGATYSRLAHVNLGDAPSSSNR